MRDSHTVARTAAVVVVSLALLSVTAPLAAAAGQTAVSVVSTDDGVGVGETTTVQVVVDDANGGVGAAEFRVAVGDVDTARLVDVTVSGSGRVNEHTAPDGSWIDVEYAFADTADTGRVVVAEVTVEGVSSGTTSITLEPAEGNDAAVVYDETGTGYSLTGTTAVRLSVEGAGSADDAGAGEDSTDGPDGSDTGGADSSTDVDSSADTDTDTDSPDGVSSADSEDTSGQDASSDSDGSSVGSVDASSNEATEQASEESDDTGAATGFGIAPDAAVLDGAGGPVGALVAVVVVGLLWLGLRRRR